VFDQLGGGVLAVGWGGAAERRQRLRHDVVLRVVGAVQLGSRFASWIALDVDVEAQSRHRSEAPR
jgi:hypothetical protein